MKTETAIDVTSLVQAIEYAFVAPSEADHNLEPANITDAVFQLSRAIFCLADAITAAKKAAP